MLSTDDCRLKTDNLAIILPVYNEKETLEELLTEWMEYLQPFGLQYHFVICEDGSTDGTKELLDGIKSKYPIVLSQKEERRGYGGAVIDGIQTADAEYILCIDSDGQCDPTDFAKFWHDREISQVLMGWRVKRADTQERKLFSNLFNTAFRLLYTTPIHDPSAPYVLFKKSTILPHMKYLGFLKEGFWWGFVGMCVKMGLSISEIPINHRLRARGQTQVYHLKKIPSIAMRNFIGLIRLRFTN